jgi:small subunit ribosomal protein S21
MRVKTSSFVQRIHGFLGIGQKPGLLALPLPGPGSSHILNGGQVLPKVVLRDGESQEKLLRRFRKAVTRSGVLSEVRKRRWFVSKSEQRRMAEKKAIRRQGKRERRRNGGR